MANAKNVSKAVGSDEKLDDDDIWSDLVSENLVPPLKVRGIVLLQPTKAQVDAWRQSQTAEDGERALFGDQYDAIHAIFRDQPEYVWENFNLKYLRHMFGTGDDAQLGK